MIVEEIMTKRQYLTKAEAAERGLYVKSDLKDQFRLKPAPDQRPVDRIWSGYDSHEVYEKSKCVPMRPKRELSEAQRASIERAREFVGTRVCSRVGCEERTHNTRTVCELCESKLRRNDAAKSAKILLESGCLIIDTETTGVNIKSEIVEISIINSYGEILFNSLVKPSSGIPEEATNIHGISDSDVANSPQWPEIHNEVISIIGGKEVVAYNAEFDERMIYLSARKYGLAVGINLDFACAMFMYSDYIEYGRNYYASLRHAAEYFGIKVEESHRSLSDCRTTLSLIKAIASEFNPEIDAWTYNR